MPETNLIDIQAFEINFSTSMFVSGTSCVRFRYTYRTVVFMRKKLIAIALYLWYNCSSECCIQCNNYF